jgi:hypothetical protein
LQRGDVRCERGSVLGPDALVWLQHVKKLSCALAPIRFCEYQRLTTHEIARMRCHTAEREGFRHDIRDGFDGFGLRLRYVHELLIARVFRDSAGQTQVELHKNPPLSTYSVFSGEIVSLKIKKSAKFIESSKLCSTGSWKLLVG